MIRVHEGELEAITLKVGRRFIFQWGSVLPKGTKKLWLDFRSDHRMYRPTDSDVQVLVCRRCGEYSDEARSSCRGRVWRFL